MTDRARRAVFTTAILGFFLAVFASQQQVAAQSSTQKVEEYFKNIKALNGQPADMLNPTMVLFEASLGVGCPYCHDNDANKSLADLSTVGALRKDLEDLADPELSASLGHVAFLPGAGSDDRDVTLSWVGSSTSDVLAHLNQQPPYEHPIPVIAVGDDRDRARAPALGCTAFEPTRITVRVGIKMKVQVPPGVKIDPARVEPPR